MFGEQNKNFARAASSLIYFFTVTARLQCLNFRFIAFAKKRRFSFPFSQEGYALKNSTPKKFAYILGKTEQSGIIL